jgi:MFS family permease
MKPQHLIMSAFFLQPLAFGAWLPRIPEIQERLGLGPAELALALLGMPLGLLATMPFAGPIVARIGGRASIAWSFPAFLLAMTLPAASGHIIQLFLALLLCGVTVSMVELGMNIVADEIERRDGLAIMSRCHGFWSLGMMAGSLISSGLAALGLLPQWLVLVVVLVVAPLAYLVPRALPEIPMPEPVAGEAKASGLFVPGGLLLAICVVGLASNLAEGATADWSAVFLTQVFSAGAATAGLGYAAYAATMALGRFFGDWARMRWGAVALVRTAYSIATVGVALFVFSPSFEVALLGFALTGIGGSVGVPLAVSAAASVGGRPAASNVAMLTLVSLIAFLSGPPVIGLIAQHLGLRAGLGLLLLPTFVLATWLASALRPRAKAEAFLAPEPAHEAVR